MPPSDHKPFPNPDENSGKVDPARLSELVERVDQIYSHRKGGRLEQVLDEVLAGLSEPERSVYSSSLTEHFFGTFQEALDTQVPTGKGFADATIELPGGFTPSGIQVDRSAEVQKPLPPMRVTSLEESQGETMPDRIGKFQIKKELGRGAFGVVYLGYDEELERNVAVKVSLVSDVKFQERLRVEASKLAQAESPGIVPVYHIGRTDDGKVYIVQKYIEGSTLRDVLRDHPLSPLAAVALMREISVGLAPAHAMEILHRDLKPDNILIDANGKAWIADFGLAISEDEQLSRKRELAGTPPYMSPEQIKGRIDFLDPRSDIWSLGVMFYELLTGKLPFNGKTRKAIAEQICELDPRPLHQRAPGLLTESMNDVFLKCCAKKPSDRFASVIQFIEALDDLVGEGLSDQNIHGRTTLASIDGSMDVTKAFPVSGLETARRFTTQGLGRSQTTRATAQSSAVSMSTPSTGWKPTVAVIATVVGLLFIVVVGYQFLIRSGESDTGDGKQSANALSAAADSGGLIVHASDGGYQAGGDSAAKGDSARLSMTDNAASDNQRQLGDGSKEKPWIVAQDETGTHTSLSSAIEEASPGDFIRVKSGLYRERILITKPLTIDGEYPKSKVYPSVLENDQESPLTIDCPDGEVMIRSFMISGKGHQLTAEFNPIEVRGGGLRLESCALETRSQNCVKVRGDGQLHVLACEFRDSSEFAISAKDFSEITVKGSDFLCRGIEVTGGAGQIESCKFFGKAGIYVANNLKAVLATNCLFEQNGAERALLATDGGNLEVTGATIKGFKTGVEATDKPMTADSPLQGRPGLITLKQSNLEQCDVAVQVTGGLVEMSDQCFIDGGLIAVGVGTGKAHLVDVSISRSKEKAVVIYQGGEVMMEKCNISGAEQTAVKITHGTFRFDGGAIDDFMLYGIVVGDVESSEPMDLSVILKDVSLHSTESKLAAIAAFSGQLDLNSVMLDGALYGVLLDGQALEGQTEEPSLLVRANGTRFKNQTGYGAVVSGNARLTMDRATHASLNASKGLKVLPPAEVVVDERSN